MKWKTSLALFQRPHSIKMEDLSIVYLRPQYIFRPQYIEMKVLYSVYLRPQYYEIL
jgi:hypothetical protein